MSEPAFIEEHLIPYRRWVTAQLSASAPAPGTGSLSDPTAMHEWLSHPSSWRKGEIFIVRWDGNVPYLSESHAYKLAPGCADGPGLVEAVVRQRQRRMAPRGKPDGADGTSDGSGGMMDPEE